METWSGRFAGADTGGRAIETPFGELLAPTITPNRTTGIDDEFAGALLNGTGRGGIPDQPDHDDGGALPACECSP